MFYSVTVTECNGDAAFRDALRYTACVIEEVVHTAANKFQLKNKLKTAMNTAPGVPGEDWEVTLRTEEPSGIHALHLTSGNNRITLHAEEKEDESDKFDDSNIEAYHISGDILSGPASDTTLNNFLHRIADAVEDASNEGLTEVFVDISFA